jgi:hypothetical protein
MDENVFKSSQIRQSTKPEEMDSSSSPRSNGERHIKNGAFGHGAHKSGALGKWLEVNHGVLSL